MKRVAGIAAVLFFLSTNIALSADSTMKANMPAQAQTVKGDKEQTLALARWPKFVAKDVFWNAGCGEYIEKENVEQSAGSIADKSKGLSLAPIYLKSAYAPSYSAGKKAEWNDLQGLYIKSFKVPDEYLTSSKIIVSWTMQVLGRLPNKSEQDQYLTTLVCPGAPGDQTISDDSMLVGQSSQETHSYKLHRKFPGGFQVKSRLVAAAEGAKLAQKGTDFSISLPDLPDLETIKTYTITRAGTRIPEPPEPPRRSSPFSFEPTLTGTVILTPSDFGGTFPKKITLQVQWINDCPVPVYTPANSRQMTVTIVPLNAQVS
jgi:hypothetical protein